MTRSDLRNLRLVVIASILILPAILAGCQIFGLTTAMKTHKVPAIYPLPQRTTAVLVDDPQTLLGDPGHATIVAANARFFLMDADRKIDVIDPVRVTTLASAMGKDFARTPVDQIGRELGVDQVVYVFIQDASIGGTEGIMMTPRATVQVKLIDSASGRRLFPIMATVPRKVDSGADRRGIATDTYAPDKPVAVKPGAADDPRGYVLAVKLPPEQGTNPRHGNFYMLQRRLAEEVGRQVAWVFVPHRAAQAGDQIRAAEKRYQ